MSSQTATHPETARPERWRVGVLLVWIAILAYATAFAAVNEELGAPIRILGLIATTVVIVLATRGTFRWITGSDGERTGSKFGRGPLLILAVSAVLYIVAIVLTIPTGSQLPLVIYASMQLGFGISYFVPRRAVTAEENRPVDRHFAEWTAGSGDYEEGIRAVRGILAGLLICLPFWAGFAVLMTWIASHG